jgi:hypothetical protein
MLDFVTLENPKMVTKMRSKKRGRPTIRRNGKAFTDAERMKRYRAKKKAEYKRRNGNWELYTPAPVIQAVKKTFGGKIDLDPASSDLAQTIVQAKKYYSVEDDGLQQEWHGKVFLNPPYAKHLIIKLTTKLMEELAAQRVTEAILLVHCKTGTKWFSKIAGLASEICFPRRIICWSPTKTDNWSMYDQAFLYFGRNPERFLRSFRNFDNVRMLRTERQG